MQGAAALTGRVLCFISILPCSESSNRNRFGAYRSIWRRESDTFKVAAGFGARYLEPLDHPATSRTTFSPFIRNPPLDHFLLLP